MKTLAELQEAVEQEVSDLATLLVPAEVTRWLNEGRTRIGILDYKIGAVSWTGVVETAALPTDLLQLVSIEQNDASANAMPSYRRWGNTLLFTTPTVGTGFATVYYRAYFPEIDDDTPSGLSEEADRGLISYALYRFWNKLATNRAHYQRYATLAGQNAVAMEDLQAEADRFYSDFLASGEAEVPEPPTTFYGTGR